tara:strand:- start:3437 stop:3985 length:549 start_codon:yes stop_codon:yes gene_type:complete
VARLPYLEKKDLKPEDQDLLARGINLQKFLAHSPGATRAHHALGSYIRHESTMDARLREMAILQVGWVAKSPYEWSHHVKIGFDFGVSEDDIKKLIAESVGEDTDLSLIDKSVLRAAREITLGGKLNDGTYAALADHFSNEHLVDLLVTISFYNAVVRFLAAAEMDVEESYQVYLDQFPLSV